MDQSEPKTKKTKLSDDDKIIKQFIKNIIIKSVLEETEKIINPIIDKYTIITDYKSKPDLLRRINMCEAKKAYLQSNINTFSKDEESLLTDDIKKFTKKSLTNIKKEVSKSLINL